MSRLSSSPSSEYHFKLHASDSEDDIDLGLLEFSISRDAPFDMTFTHQGSDLVYRARTSGRICSVTCSTRGRVRDVARLYWQKNDSDNIKVKFSGEPSIFLEDFMQVVKVTTMQRRFRANGEVFCGCFTKDGFMLTDSNGNVVGNDTRIASGLFRNRIPDTFHLSLDVLDAMDQIFVAYICMERARQEYAADSRSKYAQGWQTTPGLLCFEGPWADVMS